MALGDSTDQILLFAGPLDGLKVPASLACKGRVHVKSPTGETVRVKDTSTERLVGHNYLLDDKGVYRYQNSE